MDRLKLYKQNRNGNDVLDMKKDKTWIMENIVQSKLK